MHPSRTSTETTSLNPSLSPASARERESFLVGVTAPFSPGCTRFVKRLKSAREKTAEVIACFAVSDVFVMRAWGEILAVGERVMMLCDGLGELTRALGVSLNGAVKACLGLGVRSRRFCLASFNGVITNVDFDEESDFFPVIVH
ncbi:putative peroxiredoxin [Rosa chinensis]|uniref:glutaredoxin-dependent peroxiredoxin n=1 Tax=Rosa chinensis TaxID=74649 RepID=A0A2P6PYP7_ROSCH|nr:peroxiredoxin-2E-1, chloroplastic [Rosa chinensis]PRQ27050.1 putative peroxiredoxin [Rosa chinensis]